MKNAWENISVKIEIATPIPMTIIGTSGGYVDSGNSAGPPDSWYPPESEITFNLENILICDKLVLINVDIEDELEEAIADMLSEAGWVPPEDGFTLQTVNLSYSLAPSSS